MVEGRVKDNGPQIINWKMRNKLTTINGNPAKFWIHGTWDAEMKLMLRTNLFVTHIFPMSVNTKTVRMMYDSRKVSEVQHFISENRASISSIRRKILTQTTGDDWDQLGKLQGRAHWCTRRAEARGLFEEVWEGIMKGQPKGSRKQDVYSEFSRVKKAEEALLGAQT